MWYQAKKVKKTTKSQERDLATTAQPKPGLSRTCDFREVLGINEDCFKAKFYQNH